jgi:hypothetical protein
VKGSRRAPCKEKYWVYSISTLWKDNKQAEKKEKEYLPIICQQIDKVEHCLISQFEGVVKCFKLRQF